MRHCVSCGGHDEQVGRSAYRCSSCGRSSYVNPKAAAAVVLQDEDGRYLLAVRAQEPHRGRLDCIGGFLDVGENLETAMLRELEEESGLRREDLGAITYVGSVHDLYAWEGEQIPVTSAYFLATVRPGAVLRPADDVAEIVRVATDELRPADFAWDGMREVFAMLGLSGAPA